jgi:hypothetical protein
MKKYHYVYYSWEQWGRGYIGVRSCKCLPEEDKTYFGSFRDKTFFPTEKIILGVFESREEANQVEIKLHDFFNVGINPNFANRAKHKSSGFCVFGIPKSEEHKKKIGKANSQRLKGKPSTFKGKKHSEESLQKIRESLRGRVLSEEHKEKLRIASTGRNLSEESRLKVSKVNKGRTSPMKGKKTSDETRRKQSKVKKGKTFSEEHKNNLSKAHKGQIPWNKGKSLKSIKDNKCDDS